MSRCFRWRWAPVFGIIITNFTLLNNTFNLFTIYLSILQCTNYNHIAILFPPLRLLDKHNRLFRRPSAASNSVNPGSFSKWRPAKDVKYRRRTRVQISSSEAFAKKNFVTLFRDGFRDYFRHAYKLHTSQRQPSTRTGEFTMAAAGRASGPTRAAPGIIQQPVVISNASKVTERTNSLRVLSVFFER